MKSSFTKCFQIIIKLTLEQHLLSISEKSNVSSTIILNNNVTSTGNWFIYIRNKRGC